MMEKFDSEDLKNLYKPISGSHKGQNGKLLIVGGSRLFHGASLWALKVASRIVDMVFYASVPDNNEITQKLKSEIFDFIAIPREKIKDYIMEADVILLGPGLPREEGRRKDEESTRSLTEENINNYSHLGKKWVLDAGSLTEIKPELLKQLNGDVIITPHAREFSDLFGVEANQANVFEMSKKYNCVVLLKGIFDIVCSPKSCLIVEGGNEGMTKGGTGDVLAGLVSALACKNDLFLAAKAGSYINKKAGDELYKRVGPNFNATDLADEIPKVMKELLL
ncbi:MAG: NAD(P)H-hydrate dehydratase [Patescibacteria group bacterium]|nr:NAD(P)H-hydrate dehydratase [Patescibacteria group bacterium]